MKKALVVFGLAAMSAMAADSLEPRSSVCFSNGISGGRVTMAVTRPAPSSAQAEMERSCPRFTL